jgi:hypothetical protein
MTGGLATALDARLGERFFLDTGECSEEMLSQKLAPSEGATARRLQARFREATRVPGPHALAMRRRGVLVQHVWPRDYALYGHFDASRLLYGQSAADGRRGRLSRVPAGDRPRYLIGRSMTESTRLNSDEVRACTRVDEIWVPTEYVGRAPALCAPLSARTSSFGPAPFRAVGRAPALCTPLSACTSSFGPAPFRAVRRALPGTRL